MAWGWGRKRRDFQLIKKAPLPLQPEMSMRGLGFPSSLPHSPAKSVCGVDRFWLRGSWVERLSNFLGAAEDKVFPYANAFTTQECGERRGLAGTCGDGGERGETRVEAGSLPNPACLLALREQTGLQGEPRSKLSPPQ